MRKYFTLIFMILLSLFVVHVLAKTRTPARPVPPTHVHGAVVSTNSCGHYVVCGGVHSTAQITAAMQTPAVKVLYGNHVLTLTKTDRAFFAYDSYRIGGKIYWTRLPRFIPAGEPIWRDGDFAILVRCGNVISLDPRVPTLDTPEPDDLYPPARVYDEPVAPEIPTTDVPWTPDTSTIIYAPPTNNVPDAHTPACANCFVILPPGPPVNTPEPATGILLLIGLLVLMGLPAVVTGLLTASARSAKRSQDAASRREPWLVV